jgi:predicted short-subunit dehydrogenase-like oxidoreductase (DUF2520 family)
MVGAGNLASALAVSLHEAGYAIRQMISRPGRVSRRRARVLARKLNARATVISDPGLNAEVIWLCVPDREIAACANALASAIPDWKGRVVLHASGSQTSDELQVLRRRGAKVASAHPLMTFVRGSQPSLKGVGFAVEGDSAAVRVVREMVNRLGGKFYPIAKKRKAMYHAWATFASPLVTALLAVAEKVAGAAGMSGAGARRRMTPILRETINNYARLGAGPSFSGPIARGDVETVAKHLRGLRSLPAAVRVYRALALAAMENLPARNADALTKILKQRPNGAKRKRPSSAK